jgi:glycosyltransferase involved in cell wall biosynthesis
MRDTTLNIKLLNQENLGVSAARNAGIKHASGDYICFCDVDDRISEDYVEKLRFALLKYKADLVICKSVFMKKSGETLFEGKGNNIVQTNSEKCLIDFLYGRLTSGCCTIILRKSFLVSNNLLFEEGYSYNEDLHMLWRIIAYSEKIIYLNENLYYYHQQTNSAMSKFSERRIDGYTLMKNLEGFFEKEKPAFYLQYKKYGAARVMWSLTWQAAILLDNERFKDFIRNNNVNVSMKKLLTFKQKKVAVSSFLFLFSSNLFRYVVIKFGNSRYQ